MPEQPGAWLMATAKRRALDHLRRGPMLERKHAMIARELEEEQQAMPDLDSALDDDIGDEMLRLIFTACHPLLSREARAALALRMICGLTTEEIARAFLLPEATIAQRIVRAKRTLSESGLAYETPRGEELSERLSSVLEVVYLIFNEGYTAARGDDWMRPQLCNEALRMGRVLVAVAPREPEAHRPARPDGAERLAHRGAHRRGWRADPAARPEPRAVGPACRSGAACGRWRARASSAARAASTSCRRRSSPATPRRVAADDTDWARIAALYAELWRPRLRRSSRSTAPSPSAWPRARRRRWRIVDALADEPALKSLSSAAERSRRPARQARPSRGSRAAFETAAALTGNRREQELASRRAARAREAAAPPSSR